MIGVLRETRFAANLRSNITAGRFAETISSLKITSRVCHSVRDAGAPSAAEDLFEIDDSGVTRPPFGESTVDLPRDRMRPCRACGMRDGGGLVRHRASLVGRPRLHVGDGPGIWVDSGLLVGTATGRRTRPPTPSLRDSPSSSRPPASEAMARSLWTVSRRPDTDATDRAPTRRRPACSNTTTAEHRAHLPRRRRRDL
jgi:hypothetical protein